MEKLFDLDLMDHIEAFNFKYLVIGFNAYGHKIINSLINKNNKHLYYYLLLDASTSITDCSCSMATINNDSLAKLSNIIKKYNMIYFITDSNDYSYINKLNLSKEKDKIYIAFTPKTINSYILSIATIDSIFNDNIINAITNMTSLIAIPGMIGMDFYDVRHIITDTKSCLFDYDEDDDYIKLIDRMIAEINKKLNNNNVAGMTIVFDGGYEIMLSDIDLMIKRLKSYFKDIDYVYGTQTLNEKNKKYALSIFTAVRNAN